MYIALSGPSGVAKTTVAIRSSIELGITFCPSIVRTVLVETGVKNVIDSDDVEKMQMILHHTKHLIEQNYRKIGCDYITDRSHLDVLAYTLIFCSQNPTSSWWIEDCTDLALKYAHSYDFTFLFEPNPNMDKDDARIHNYSHQLAVYAILRGLYQHYCIPHTIIPLNTSIDQKVNIIIKMVKKGK